MIKRDSRKMRNGIVVIGSSKINYEDYRKLIYKISWWWNKKTGWPIDDLISEGNAVFCLALQYYVPRKKIQFSTYLVKTLGVRFRRVTIEKKRIETQELSRKLLDSVPAVGFQPDAYAAFTEAVNRLSGDARSMVECVLDTPLGLLWMSGPRRKSFWVSRNNLKKYFMLNRGWTGVRVDNTCREIRSALDSLNIL
jgi:hypothetical protein